MSGRSFFLMMHRVNPDCPENIVYRIDRAKFSSAVADRIILEHPDLEGVVCSVTFLPVLLPAFREELPGVPLVSFGENDLLNRDTDRIMNFISGSRENVGHKATELLEKLCRGKAAASLQAPGEVAEIKNFHIFPIRR